jgi:hypothetical protein
MPKTWKSVGSLINRYIGVICIKPVLTRYRNAGESLSRYIQRGNIGPPSKVRIIIGKMTCFFRINQKCTKVARGVSDFGVTFCIPLDPHFWQISINPGFKGRSKYRFWMSRNVDFYKKPDFDDFSQFWQLLSIFGKFPIFGSLPISQGPYFLTFPNFGGSLF